MDKPDTVLPLAHWLVQRQLPPVLHEVLVQHLILLGSLGQKPEADVPPPELQIEVSMQTPGVPLTEQTPFTAAWARPTETNRIERVFNI